MNLRDAAQQALKALLGNATNPFADPEQAAAEDAAITALRAALAEPVQEEPVAYIHRQGNHWEVSERYLVDDEKARGWTEEPLYTAPPQRKPLTEEEIGNAANSVRWSQQYHVDFARAIERAHGIGGQDESA